MAVEVWLAVAVGGALGACGRYGVFLAGAALLGTAWPWGTLAANLLGSFLLAWLATRGHHGLGPAGPWAKLWTTGFCGAFTTYSTFNLEVLELARHRGLPHAGLYLGATVLLAAAAGWSGVRAAGGP